MPPPDAAPPSLPPRSVRCPACGGVSRYAADNPYRPFCRARCRQHDLGAWASESFRLEAQEADGTDQAAPAHPSAPRFPQ